MTDLWLRFPNNLLVPPRPPRSRAPSRYPARGYCRKIFAPSGQRVYRTALPFLQVVIIPSPDNRFVCHEIDGPAIPTIPALSFRETSGEEAMIPRILRVVGFCRCRNTFFSSSLYRPLFSKYRPDPPLSKETVLRFVPRTRRWYFRVPSLLRSAVPVH